MVLKLMPQFRNKYNPIGVPHMKLFYIQIFFIRSDRARIFTSDLIYCSQEDSTI